MGRGSATLSMKVTRAHTQYQGIAHGGALTALADTAATFACNSLLSPDEDSVTIELKMNFLGSARAGETIVARATPAHVGRTTHVWDAVVENQTSGKTIALFRATQLILRPDSSPRAASADGAR